MGRIALHVARETLDPTCEPGGETGQDRPGDDERGRDASSVGQAMVGQPALGCQKHREQADKAKDGDVHDEAKRARPRGEAEVEPPAGAERRGF